MFNQEVGLLLYQGCLTKHNTEKGSLYWRFIGWCKFVSCQIIFDDCILGGFRNGSRVCRG